MAQKPFLVRVKALGWKYDQKNYQTFLNVKYQKYNPKIKNESISNEKLFKKVMIEKKKKNPSKLYPANVLRKSLM